MQGSSIAVNAIDLPTAVYHALKIFIIEQCEDAHLIKNFLKH